MSGTRVIEQRAVRQGIKARIALAGVTGSGKSFTSLSIATELQGDLPVLGIDTERRSMKLYGHDPGCTDACTRRDHFTFEYLDWQPPYDVAELTHLIESESHKYGVIVLDSLSHFWKGEGGMLDTVDAIAARGGAGKNTYAAWNQGSTIQNQMVEAILSAKCHMICTMRSKMAYEQTKNERTGKTEIVKLGLAPVQRDDLEYEFTVLGELDREHRLIVTKSRCSLIADKVYPPANERRMARTLVDWLDTAAVDEAVRMDVTLDEARDRVIEHLGGMDAQERKLLVVEVRQALGIEPLPAGTTVSGWVRAGDAALLGLFVERLRLPLRLSPFPGSDGAGVTPEPSDPSASKAASSPQHDAKPEAGAPAVAADHHAPQVSPPAPVSGDDPDGLTDPALIAARDRHEKVKAELAGANGSVATHGPTRAAKAADTQSPLPTPSGASTASPAPSTAESDGAISAEFGPLPSHAKAEAEAEAESDDIPFG